MAIQVTCPGCLKRFQVHDKFAGKTGPCPNCSKPIVIPSKADEVVIHAPSEGPKDSKGRPVFQPIRRVETKLTLPMILVAAGLSVVSLVVAIAVRLTNTDPPTALLAIGAILLAPPLIVMGYWFLHDEELEGFRGKDLIVRTAILTVVFTVTWALYGFIPKYLNDYRSMAQFDMLSVVIVVPIMIGLGAVASVLTFELEGVQGLLHYLLYFAVTLILAIIMGTQLATPFARTATEPVTPGTPATKAFPPVPAASGKPQAPVPPVDNKGTKKRILQ